MQWQGGQLRGDCGDKIETFLIYEPADDAHHWQLWIVRQPELSPQRRAIAHFGSRCLRRGVPGNQVTIGRRIPGVPIKAIGNRSEEHTSELQSHLNLVCRLLLEK